MFHRLHPHRIQPGIMKTLFLFISFFFFASAHAQFVSLFDGETLEGWTSNDERPNCFSVEDGAIKVSGGRAHLFYTGAVSDHSFQNFEFNARVKTTPGANSGIYFHTEFQDKGWPKKGYEAQINSTHKDVRKTSSLYAIQDVHQSPSKDGEWFDYLIRVEGKHIQIIINGETQVDWTEPDHWTPPKGMSGRLLNKGTFAFQAHDPKSTVFIKDIAVKVLED